MELTEGRKSRWLKDIEVDLEEIREYLEGMEEDE